MTDKIRWGILSTANIGRRRVVPAILKASNGEVAAVASRSQASAQAFADEFGIPAALGSYEALLEADIDAVYNPLPNHLHAEWSIKFAEAGIPTLCEKPLASDAAEAQSIVDAFAARGVLFAEAFMYRFHPQHAKVLEIIAAGGIGELRAIKATFSFVVRSEDNIRLRKDMAGGSVMDVGCYCINAMRLLTGEEPVSAKAVANIGPVTGVDETLAGVLQFPSGVVGHFDSSLRAHHEHSYELRGSAGRIWVPESFVPDPTTDTAVHHWQGDSYTLHKIDAVDQYQLMVEDFGDALLSSRPPRFAPQDAVANMRVIDALRVSVGEG